jgi:hypothetical protein
VTFATTGGLLTDSANLAFNGTDLTVSGAVNATTVDTTNIEVTNIKAKDGTASASIADSTGVFSHATTTVFPAGAVGTPAITTTGDTNTGIFFPAADTIAFAEGGAEAMRIDSDGDVGIGVTNPTSKLHVGGQFAVRYANPDVNGIVLQATTTTNASAMTFQNQAGSNNLYVGLDSSTGNRISGAAYAGSFWHEGAYPLAFGTSNAERMRITSAGNVGIGTSSPGVRLDVAGGIARIIPSGGSANNPESGAGTLNVYGATSGITTRTGALRLESFSDMATNAGTGIAFSARVNTAPNDGSYTFAKIGGYKENATTGSGAGYLAFATTTTPGDLTERARITSSGDFLLGTTDAGVSTGVGFRVLQSRPTTTQTDTTNSTTVYEAYSTGATAYRFYVGMAGTVFATNTTISAISDQRYKENIRDLDIGLDAVMQLKPRKFDWKEGKGQNTKDCRGFIAQEFEEVFPDLIDEWRDPAPEGEEPYKSVRQDLIPVLVKAIQELKAELDTVKAELATLKGN